MKTSALFLVMLSIILLSCGGNDDLPGIPSCGDLSSLPTEFVILDFEVEVLVDSDIPIYPWRVFGDSQYSEGVTVAFDDVVLSFGSTNEYIYADNINSSPFRFSFFSKAVACSPRSPQTNQKITGFRITSSRDFNEDHPSGDTLNALFDIIYSESESPFYEIIDSTYSYLSLAEYMNQDDVLASEIIQLRLNTEPLIPASHVFTVTISLDSGESFVFETPEISFI